ncbi:MAG: DUF58 domain-containing protein [Actinomycetota bacterium]
MLTARGWAVLGGGIALYVGSRVVGSPNLHVAAFGVMALPLFAAAVLRLSRAPLTIRRRPSSDRAYPGSRLRVDVEIHNESGRMTPLILFEDRVPASFGRSARAVLPGIPAGNDQTISYLVTCRRRGRYTLGPARLQFTDPFGLSRAATTVPDTDDLIVYPDIEDLSAQPVAAFGAGTGESPYQRIFRSGREFYGMREYMTGDDLRRIHWPSTAKSGHLMIRQEEVARRAIVTLLLDTRSDALGRDGTPAFERAVSAAASVGALMGRRGFSLRLSTPDVPPASFSEDAYLDQLASITSSRQPSLGPALLQLKGKAVADSTLVVVTAPPNGAEVTALIRAAAGYGPRMAVLVYPNDPSSLATGERAELEGRASAARASLARVGWDVFLIAPDRKLSEVWRSQAKPMRRVAGSRSS